MRIGISALSLFLLFEARLTRHREVPLQVEGDVAVLATLAAHRAPHTLPPSLRPYLHQLPQASKCAVKPLAHLQLIKALR